MATKRVDYREASKVKWNSSADENGWPGTEQVNAGSLMRIADATELMAKNILALQNDMERYKRWYESEQKDNVRLQRSNNALRGYINRLKKKKSR